MSRFAGEACDRRYDPVSGALITQLTSSAASSINIYCEQPYASPDGQRVAILRRYDVSFDASWRLLVADLKKLWLTMIEADGVVGFFNAAWSGQLYYTMQDDRMYCVDLQTLEKRPVPLPPGTVITDRGPTMSPDQRHIMYFKYLPGPEVGLVLVDLHEQTERIVYHHPETVNPHVQFNPVHGQDVLVLHNRGGRLTADNEIDRIFGEAGPTYFLMAPDGTRIRPLPAGRPFTGPCTGHANHVAATGKVCFTTLWNYRDWSLGEGNDGGNLFVAGPDDAAPTVFRAPEHRFNHVNVSRCGRYFVADSMPGSMYDSRGELSPTAIVIGNLETGRYRTLVQDSRSTSGAGQHQHVHAYLTATNRHVIYNANPHDGPTQVWAAHVTPDFLASLD
jgi:hypothetical protein